MGFWVFDELGFTGGHEDEEDKEGMVLWETSSFVCLDDLIGNIEDVDYNIRLGEVANNNHDVVALKTNLSECGPSIPQILYLIGSGVDDTASASKRNGLQQLVEISAKNDASIWGKFFNQILTVVMEVLDYSDPLIRELALSLIIEMLKNQKTTMEDSVEIVMEKLLNVTKDSVPKVANDAGHCLSVVLSQHDPFRCLSVIVPLLVAEDEKTLVVCINCLTKIVGPLSQDELTTQIPSFLPALFEAFGNQSADVRKVLLTHANIAGNHLLSLLGSEGPLRNLKELVPFSWSGKCIDFIECHGHPFILLARRAFVQLCSPDRRLLSGGYLHHSWQSIITIPGGAQRYAVEVGHYLRQSNLASSGGLLNRQ